MHIQKIVILGTGGTIAGSANNVSDNIGYTTGQVSVEQLVRAIPGLAAASNLVIEQVVQIDSKDMTFVVWAQLASRVNYFLGRDDVGAVVITHGTDTIEETAYFLQAVVSHVKPVVLTCAMRPATALSPDGPQNVLDAIAVAGHAGAQGTMVVCAGVVHDALNVQKTHTYQLNAFSSGDAGPVGYVEEGKLRLVRNWPLVQQNKRFNAIKNIALLGSGSAWPEVEIVMSYAGARGAVVEALVARGVQGLVIAGTGNGTVHKELETALLQAQAGGVSIVRATRCVNGRVLPKAGDVFEDSDGLSPVKARIDLMLRLMDTAIC